MTCKLCNDTGVRPSMHYGQLPCNCPAGLTREPDDDGLKRLAFRIGREYGERIYRREYTRLWAGRG